MHYHHLLDTRTRLTAYQIKEQARNFLEKQKLSEIAAMLKLEKHQLVLLSKKQEYESFYLPKPKGGYRLIQSPKQPLKGIQEKLGRMFQYVYFTQLPDPAYGFILSPKDEKHPRNIYTQALQHQGQKWFLNLDLASFFHHIYTKQIEQMLREAPFGMTEDASTCLARIVSYEGRLPMGAPSSPVFSNLAARKLDQQLIELAHKQKWKYTRYADDLTISSQKKLSSSKMQVLRKLITNNGFKIQTKKLRLQHKSEPPEITGLCLHSKGPDVSKSFIKGIQQDLDILSALSDPHMIQRGIFSYKPIKRLRASIQGQINFLAFIRGKDHKSVKKFRRILKDSIHQHRG